MYEVASTGAFVDVRSSVQMLLHYCQQLPHDKYFVPQPIYWFDRTGVSFRCSVLLPVTAPAQCRCAMSPFVRTKDLAKGLVSLECVKNLHFFGELDDSLLNVDRKKPQAPPQKLDLPRVEVPSGQPEEESDCEADADGPAPRTRTKDMGLAIELQSVPQMLSFVCDEDATGFGVMYLYCATVRANSREEMDVLTSCLGTYVGTAAHTQSPASPACRLRAPPGRLQPLRVRAAVPGPRRGAGRAPCVLAARTPPAGCGAALSGLQTVPRGRAAADTALPQGRALLGGRAAGGSGARRGLECEQQRTRVPGPAPAPGARAPGLVRPSLRPARPLAAVPRRVGRGRSAPHQ